MLPSGLLLEQARIVWLHDVLILSPERPYAAIDLSELPESDRYPKVNTPFRSEWRILVKSHPFF
jgi:hypothetical protein